jgi:transcriptional regulator with XRE-family HTH domain
VGYRIREIRESKGISQTELSERSGISRATIWKLETDDKAVTMTSTLLKIASALDVSLDEIFLADDV